MKRFLAHFVFAFLTVQIAFAQGSPKANNQQVLKVLAIGNSFSEDALENYLHELANAVDQEIVIGNLYIGGAPLDLHVKNTKADKSAYSYRKVKQNGERVTTENVSIAQALQDESWDYVSFQQASPLSGKYDVIMQSLPELLAYVRERVSPHTQFVYHQTWAYQQNSKHEGFVGYDNSQQIMYKSISKTSRKLSKNHDFAFIVPAGTAVQNGRTSSIGDEYTRDGYHLNLDFGRFTAACTWYEKLFGLDVRKNPYKPQKVTDLQADIARAAAHAANKKPFKVSQIKK